MAVLPRSLGSVSPTADSRLRSLRYAPDQRGALKPNLVQYAQYSVRSGAGGVRRVAIGVFVGNVKLDACDDVSQLIVKRCVTLIRHVQRGVHRRTG